MKEEKTQGTKEEMPRAFRIVRTSYTYGTSQEEKGGLVDVVQSEEHQKIIWRGTAVDSDRIYTQGINMPRNDYDSERTAPTYGDSDFSYELQEQLPDGNWQGVRYLKASRDENKTRNDDI